MDFLALTEFQDLCSNKIVLIVTDNTMMVVYIKEGRRHEIGPTVCPFVENPDLVFQETAR